jgi:prepilin-type N-terminal cleavage/methylation domain-containing protein
MKNLTIWPQKLISNSVHWCNGFTLSEVVITVGIIGILSSIALPNYFRQIQRTHQAEANATMSQIMATVAAFVDEFGTQPERWVDLNAMTTLMTNQGPAVIDDGVLTKPITLPGERYQLVRINNMPKEIRQ